MRVIPAESAGTFDVHHATGIVELAGVFVENTLLELGAQGTELIEEGVQAFRPVTGERGRRQGTQ
jgi:hypothetical protein